jgi:hypothetical protein
MVVGYYTFEPIRILNPTTIDSKLECSLFLTQLEQLHHLE